MGFLWIITAALLVYLLQSVLYARYWKKGLRVRLRFTPGAIREGEEGELKEVVQNRKYLPLPLLQVNLQSDRSLHFAEQENTAVSDQTYRRDIYALLPFQQITRTLHFVGTKRGYHPCREVELVGRTLFFEGPYVDKQPQKTELYVYPRTIPTEQVETACQEMLGEYQWNKKLFEDPFSFRGIRDYGPGDSFRQVNWKASARMGELKVNVYEHVAMAKAQILLNVEGDQIWTEELLLEGAIRIVAAMALQWIETGIPVGIRTNGRDVVTGDFIRVDPGAGPGHAVQILQALSRIDLTRQPQTGRTGAGAIKPERSEPGTSREGQPGAGSSAVGQSGAGSSAVGQPDRETARTIGQGEEADWLWEGQSGDAGPGPGGAGGLLLYVSAGSRKKDLEQLERIRQQGAVVRWVRPCTWQQEEQQKVEVQRRQERAGEMGEGKQESTGKMEEGKQESTGEIGEGKRRPQDIYRGQIIEWRVEG